MKKVFELDAHKASLTGSTINIIGTDSKPFVSITLPDNKGSLFIEDKDLKRFAINILKALLNKQT